MTTFRFPPSFALLIALVSASALLGLTGCQTPVLGVGTPVEELPPQQGVPVQDVPW